MLGKYGIDSGRSVEMFKVLHTHHVLSNDLVTKALEGEPRDLRFHHLGRPP